MSEETASAAAATDAGIPEAAAINRVEGGISGDTVDVDQSIHHTGVVNQYIGIEPSEFGDEHLDHFRLQPREVSAASFESYEVEQILRRAGDVLHDSEEIERLLGLAEQHRILFLTGQDQLGKAQTATLLAARLVERHPRVSAVLWMSQPEPNLRMAPQTVADDAEQFGGRVLIIKDAFSLRNATLTRFVSRLDASKLQRLSDSLERNDVFWLLTSDDLPLLTAESSLKSLGLLAELQLPTTEQLRQCLNRQLERYFPLGERTEEQQATIDQVSEDSNHIFDELQTIPHVVAFVEHSLRAVADGELELEEALRQSRGVKGWLLKLAADFDTWCGALALILCYPVPAAGSLPWYDFHRVREVVTRFMRRELRVVRRDLAPARLLDDGDLVHALRAETQKLAAGPDLIRFRDRADAARLWGILLNHCRGLLSSMASWLSGLARERHPAHPIAARALGRIGEIAPDRITFQLITEFANREDDGDSLLGYLLQGTLGSEDSRYQRTCLEHLRRLTRSPSPECAITAIRSLRYLGELDLTEAMTQLEEVVARRFAPRLRGFSKLEGELRRAGRELAEALTRGAATRLSKKDHQMLLGLLTKHILEGGSEQEGKVLYAVQYTLVGLCFELDPIDVLGQLNGWLVRDSGRMAPLISFLFLNEKGIGNLLGRFQMVWLPVDEENPGEVLIACHRIVVSMAYSEDSIHVMTTFLTKIFQACALFPGAVGQYFRHLFGELLKGWVSQNHPQDRCCSALTDLFARLLNSPDRKLGEFVFEMLNHDTLFTEPESDLADFASEALARAF